MNDEIWKPNVTVAAVIERDGRYLLVEEATDDGIRLNQPAGHLDEDESLIAACARETLEESAWEFTPTALVGVYQWKRPQGGLAAGPSQGEVVNKMERGEPRSPLSWGKGAGVRPSITYLRFAFAGTLGAFDAKRQLDTGILRALWLTPEDIRASQDRHRSPLILRCVEDHLSGRRFPLNVIRHYAK